MSEVTTADAKYVFLDIVGFTRGRSVEAQADIVTSLNEVVRESLKIREIPEHQRLLLPTGDGICIVLFGKGPLYDAHVLLALAILERVEEHNSQTEDEMRRFRVRVGINANTDNLITDINERQNVAGAGINGAQRVMNSADGGQVLVSDAVYDTLMLREKYMEVFRHYTATTKHGEAIRVHQLVKEGTHGLNLDVPSAFEQPEQPKSEELRLSKQAAYYLAHALASRKTFMQHKDEMYDDHAAVVLLSLLAKDSTAQSETTSLERHYPDTYKAGQASRWEQYQYYAKLDSHVIFELSRSLEFGTEVPLIKYLKCFAKDKLGVVDFRDVSDHGQRKLKEEWPEIWDEFKTFIEPSPDNI